MKIPELPSEKILREYLVSRCRIAIAFSGGCDSALLAAFAVRALGRENVFAIHAATPMTFVRENVFARDLAGKLGIGYAELQLDALRVPEIVRNDPRRCYFCKRFLFSSILGEAVRCGFPILADGANTDDRSDYRPGAKAADELGVIHPFSDCGIGKRLIRLLARRLDLETWNLPAAACLASRIPAGVPLSAELLRLAGCVEEYLESLSFHGHRARMVSPGVVELEFRGPHYSRAVRIRDLIESELKKRFSFHTVTIKNYRMGAMNKPS